jgi:NADPH-dependent ferric siderophore reductase
MHLLIGDETALPAIGRRLEELPDAARAMVVMECDDASRGYPLRSNAKFERVEVCRAHGGEAATEELVRTLRELQFPTKKCFAWAAAESQSARAIRRYLINERGFDKNWIKAAGYWQRGAIASHEVIQDES